MTKTYLNLELASFNTTAKYRKLTGKERKR